jgi:DNA gyrase subunit A
MLFTRNGMAVRFDESLVRPIGRVGRGVRGILLKNEKEDKVVGCEVVTPDQTILVVCERGYGKRSNVDDFRQTNRGGVGVRSIITSERNGMVVAALSVADSDSVLLMSAEGQAVRIRMRDVRVMGRSTQGVRLVNVKEEGDLVVAAQKIEAVAEDCSIAE